MGKPNKKNFKHRNTYYQDESKVTVPQEKKEPFKFNWYPSLNNDYIKDFMKDFNPDIDITIPGNNLIGRYIVNTTRNLFEITNSDGDKIWFSVEPIERDLFNVTSEDKPGRVVIVDIKFMFKVYIMFERIINDGIVKKAIILEDYVDYDHKIKGFMPTKKFFETKSS